MLTAREAAEILGISIRMVYELAAPVGPIPCFRYTSRCLRFDRADIEQYLKSCRIEQVKMPPFRVPLGRTITLRASDPNGESNLRKFFREKGIVPKLRPDLKKGRGK